jgi:hypothetical protein
MRVGGLAFAFVQNEDECIIMRNHLFFLARLSGEL